MMEIKASSVHTHCWKCAQKLLCCFLTFPLSLKKAKDSSWKKSRTGITRFFLQKRKNYTKAKNKYNNCQFNFPFKLKIQNELSSPYLFFQKKQMRCIVMQYSLFILVLAPLPPIDTNRSGATTVGDSKRPLMEVVKKNL